MQEIPIYFAETELTALEEQALPFIRQVCADPALRQKLNAIFPDDAFGQTWYRIRTEGTVLMEHNVLTSVMDIGFIQFHQGLAQVWFIVKLSIGEDAQKLVNQLPLNSFELKEITAATPEKFVKRMQRRLAKPDHNGQLSISFLRNHVLEFGENNFTSKEVGEKKQYQLGAQLALKRFLVLSTNC